MLQTGMYKCVFTLQLVPICNPLKLLWSKRVKGLNYKDRKRPEHTVLPRSAYHRHSSCKFAITDRNGAVEAATSSLFRQVSGLKCCKSDLKPIEFDSIHSNLIRAAKRYSLLLQVYVQATKQQLALSCHLQRWFVCHREKDRCFLLEKETMSQTPLARQYHTTKERCQLGNVQVTFKQISISA